MPTWTPLGLTMRHRNDGGRLHTMGSAAENPRSPSLQFVSVLRWHPWSPSQWSGSRSKTNSIGFDVGERY